MVPGYLRVKDYRNRYISSTSKNPRYNNMKSNSDKGKDKSNIDQDAPCPIHGGSHNIGQCKLIQQEKSK